MKTELPTKNLLAKCIGKVAKRKNLLALVLGIALTSSNLFASHFRYGVATATRLSETSTTVTYRLNVSEAWRLNSASSSARFVISGGNTGSLTVPMTVVTDPSGQWSNSSGSAVITLNKSATPTTLRNTGCCKISTIMNNRDRSWDEYIVLRTDQPGSSPVSTLPAIINMPVNAPAATYTIPATDPDAGSTVTFGSPSFTGNLSGQSQPSGFAINATTGQITLNTVGKTIGQQYNALVTVTDNNGNQIMLDFLINMVGASTPPVFDYTVTPTNGTVYNVMAGQNLSFPVRATDGDAGSTVSMSVAGLPSYITTGNFSNAALPATGNPSLTNFSWTPSGAQIGTTNVLNFIATDNVGVQTTTSVTIRVVAEPAPVFIAPTALQNSFRQIETGQLFNDTIVAQSPIGSNVSIAFATGIPAAASLSPAVPTAGANPAQTILSWTPTPADFGVKTFGYQATIAAFPTIFTTRNFTVIVNTTPTFTSTPVTSVVAGQTYTYNVTVSDANIPYGDTVEVIGSGLPSWLTLVSTGNGTATLSGTPSIANVGVYEIGLEAEDIYHHGPNAHVHQHFDLAVLAPANITTTGNTTFCQGSSITLTANSGTGLTYQWKKDGNNITGATSISYNATSAGSYTAQVTSGGISSISNAINVTVNPSVVITNCPQTQYEQIYTDSNSCTTAFNYNPTISGATDITYTFSGATTASGNGTGSGSSFNIGQTTVTITASGICGTATCSFVVTVIDNKKPIALTKNVTVYLNANGTASVNANDINNGSSDNCGPVSVSLSQTGIICGAGTENQNVTLSAPAGAKITSINFASYGNPTGTCGNFTQGWCHALNSKSVVEGYALNQSSVTIPATNGVFGDPCNGTVKRLYVQATWTGTAATNTFNCNNVGNNTVTLVVTDANGNVSTQTATVTVIDTIAPTATAQNVTIQLNSNGAASTTATAVNNGSSDNCGIASVSLSKTSFDCTNVGNNNVTLTVTDVNGNVSTASAVVTVQDNIAPTAVAQNVTIQLDANGAASTAATAVNNGSTDNCGIASISLSKTSFDCTNVGNNNVTLTVTDVNGNVSTATAVVTVQDNIAPTAVAQNVTIQLDANGAASTTATAVNNGSSDNCGIASVSLSKTSFDCTNVGNNNVTLTVTDVNGNVSTASAVVTVQDNIAPTAVAQNVTIQLDANGAASTTATAVNNGSTDNCGIASVSLSKTSFNCSNVGNNNVTLTVTDVNGNVSTASAVVTVQDNIAPTAVAQNVTIQLDANGAASTTATAVNNGSTDNCGIASVSLSKTSFDCTNVGNNNVTLTVTDVNGNVSTASAVVTVQDNIAPTAIAKNVTVTLANGGASVTAAQINNGSFDNCGIANLSVSPSTFNCGNIGNNTVTLTVTDVNGNVSTTTSTVNVVGVVPTCSVASAPRNNGTVIGSTNTLAAVNQMFLGYGAQSMNITCTATGGGPFTYSWSGSGLSNYNIANPVFTPTAGGNYTLTCTITNAYGCQSTCSITICVIDVRSNGGSPNNPKVLLCHYPPGNSNNPQTLSISVNAVPAHIGQHGGDKLGSCNAVCGFAKTNVDGDMYTQEMMDGEINLIVYPNPSNSAFNFKLETESTEPVTITLYDMSGRMVMNLTNQNPTDVITIAQEMAAGVYMANVTQGEFVKTVKITKVN